MIMMLFVMLLSLTACETISTDNASTIVQYKIDEVSPDKVSYKAQVTNSTIFNFYDISFDIELYKDGERVERAASHNPEDIIINHGQSVVFEGTFIKAKDFDEAKIVNLKFQTTSFMDTYRAFVILMPIITVIISAIVMYQLLKSDNASSIDGRKTSAIGLFGLFAMSLMINTIGWVPILFIFVASGLIFLSGYIAVIIKKHQYVPQEVIDAMNKKKEEEEALKNASNEAIIDATIVDDNATDDKNEEDKEIIAEANEDPLDSTPSEDDSKES